MVAAVNLRACESGEAFLADGRCEECPRYSYLLDPLSAPSECKECPANSFCFGGTKIGPRPGYWRRDALSTEMVPCFKPDSCTGTSEDAYQVSGGCAEGHEGFLCGGCELGYGHGSEYDCNHCPSLEANIGVSCALGVLFLVGMVLAIR